MFGVIVLSAAILASPAAPPSPPADRAPRQDGSKEMLRIYFMDQARRELNLSDEQTLKLLPLFDQLEGLREQATKTRRRLAADLRRLAESEKPPELAEVRRTIQAMDEAEEQHRVEQNQVRDRMLDLLDPGQQARFIVFIQGFRQRLERRLRALRRGAEGRRGRAPGEQRRDRPSEPPGQGWP